jgi:DNA repair protein RadC
MEIAQERTPNIGSPKLTVLREIRVNYRRGKREQTVISNPSDAASLIRKVLPDNSREHFVAVYLDAAHQTIGYGVTFTGTANMCLLHPREVYQTAVLLGATGVLVAHNHPTGQTKPSQEDRDTTKALREAGRILGISLLDHVIVTDDSHYSFSEQGEL